jgi:hypothetical protein
MPRSSTGTSLSFGPPREAIRATRTSTNERVLVTRGKDSLFVYTYTGSEFTLRMGTISGAGVAASWFNPRTGATTKAGTHKNSGTIAFDPPGVKANGNDWVLVLDDTATRFPAPGAGTLH